MERQRSKAESPEVNVSQGLQASFTPYSKLYAVTPPSPIPILIWWSYLFCPKSAFSAGVTRPPLSTEGQRGHYCQLASQPVLLLCGLAQQLCYLKTVKSRTKIKPLTESNKGLKKLLHWEAMSKSQECKMTTFKWSWQKAEVFWSMVGRKNLMSIGRR